MFNTDRFQEINSLVLSGDYYNESNLVLPHLATEFHSSAFPDYIFLLVSHHNKVFENLLNV